MEDLFNKSASYMFICQALQLMDTPFLDWNDPVSERPTWWSILLLCFLCTEPRIMIYEYRTWKQGWYIASMIASRSKTKPPLNSRPMLKAQLQKAWQYISISFLYDKRCRLSCRVALVHVVLAEFDAPRTARTSNRREGNFFNHQSKSFHRNCSVDYHCNGGC